MYIYSDFLKACTVIFFSILYFQKDFEKLSIVIGVFVSGLISDTAFMCQKLEIGSY